MAGIETLTDADRDALDWPMPHRAEAKALRIIDALTEALAEAEHAAHVQSRGHDLMAQQYMAAEARVRELETENEGACIEAGVQRSLADAAERWRVKAVTMCEAAESRLATATALLERCAQDLAGTVAMPAQADRLAEAVAAFLAGQPAAPTRKLEQELAKLGLHHMGESSEHVRRRMARPTVDAKTCTECGVVTPFSAPGFNHAATCSEVGGQPVAPARTEGESDESQREVRMVRPVGGSVLGPQDASPLRVPAADAAVDVQQIAPTRTEAEQAVLDVVRRWVDGEVTSVAHIAQAELALRGLK